MKFFYVIPWVIYFLFFQNTIWMSSLIAQTQYEDACKELKKVSFQNKFNFELIEDRCNDLLTIMDSISEKEYENCNCADTLWIARLKDRRRFKHYPYSPKIDTIGYLKMLPLKLDDKNLQQEFKFNKLRTVQDSFKYVLNRIKKKEDKRTTYEYNWQTIYYYMYAELKFIENNKYQLRDAYWQVFDDSTNSEYLRDRLLSTFFYSDESIEDEILSRIELYQRQRYFYRMLGILRTSGTGKSVDKLVRMMKENEFDINIQKSILQAIYGVTDRQKVSRKTRKNFEHYLKLSQLDTLSRYDLFIKED